MTGNRGTVVVWGLAEDPPTSRVVEELRRTRVRIAWLDQQQSASHSLELRADGLDGTLHLSDEAIELCDVSGAYLRPYDVRQLAGGTDDELARGIYGWAEITRAVVMNRLSAMATNVSKPFQAELIRRHGFAVPETLITTDRDAVLAFWAKHGAIIYKSISSRRSIVARLCDADRARLERVARCPTQFQQWVPGIDYRVHVVGDDLHACRIRSTESDYRYDRSAIVEAVTIPETIAERCYRVTKALGLELGGVDLRQSPAGDWYCFEVNPSPGFTYFEAATEQPIAASIAASLSRAHLAA